jgi:hypothetical protein
MNQLLCIRGSANASETSLQAREYDPTSVPAIGWRPGKGGPYRQTSRAEVQTELLYIQAREYDPTSAPAIRRRPGKGGPYRQTSRAEVRTELKISSRNIV